MTDKPVLWTLDSRGVGRVTLNRPEVNNAYDGALIQGLHDAMTDLGGRLDYGPWWLQVPVAVSWQVPISSG